MRGGSVLRDQKKGREALDRGEQYKGENRTAENTGGRKSGRRCRGGDQLNQVSQFPRPSRCAGFMPNFADGADLVSEKSDIQANWVKIAKNTIWEELRSSQEECATPDPAC